MLRCQHDQNMKDALMTMGGHDGACQEQCVLVSWRDYTVHQHVTEAEQRLALARLLCKDSVRRGMANLAGSISVGLPARGLRCLASGVAGRLADGGSGRCLQCASSVASVAARAWQRR